MKQLKFILFISKKGISGAFSGKLTYSSFDNINITDGSFKLPYNKIIKF